MQLLGQPKILEGKKGNGFLPSTGMTFMKEGHFVGCISDILVQGIPSRSINKRCHGQEGFTSVGMPRTNINQVTPTVPIRPLVVGQMNYSSPFRLI